MITQTWTGTHISGSRPAVVVRYHGPTNTKGSCWRATLKRDSETTWRGSAPFQDGPVAAWNALRFKHGLHDWTVERIGSIDPDTYVILTA